METRRMALIAVLGVILYLIYTAWITDHPSVPVPTSVSAPAAAVPADPTAPPVPSVASTDAAGAAPTVAASATPAVSSQTIKVKTDLIDAEFATAGAELRRVELKAFALDKKNPEVKLPLLNDRDGVMFTLQSGLAAVEKPLASGSTVFTTAQTSYEMAAGVDSLDVPFEYTDASGYTLTKTYRFKRGSYQAELVQTISNKTGTVLNVSPYARWLRNPVSTEKAQKFIVTFLGMGVYEQKPGTAEYRFKKIKLGALDDKPYESKQTGGWLAMIQHYFIAAIIPPADEALTMSGKPAGGGNYLSQYLGATKPVADGADASYTTGLYIGPKTQGALDDVAKGLALTEDYGILTPIAKPLFWTMNFFHGLVGNWGWSIILLTVLIKAAFFPLSAASYKSMAKMRVVTPKMTKLKEMYGDDRARLNQEMMELYKKEKINPLGGCLPIMVQIPVFISLYWVLLGAVEMRNAPWLGWITDLSVKDPFFVLPLIMGATMLIQTKLNPTPPDPMQAKVMMIMPIVFTGMFLFFPSGLVLYWVVNNVLSIAQQWQITRMIEGGKKTT